MSEDDRSEYVKQMARRLDLTLPPVELVRVIAVFGNLERAAALVADAELSGDTVAAAVFRPEGHIEK